MQSLDIGVDVGRDELVIAVAQQEPRRVTVANRVGAIREWLRTIPVGSRLAVESTGSYHRELVEQAQQGGLTVYVLNAGDVHHYAKALGMRGKTDRTDAQVIVRYLCEHHAYLHAYCGGTALQQRLQSLLRLRALVGRQRAQLVQSLREVPQMAPAGTVLCQAYEQVQRQLEQQMQQALASEPALAQGYTRLRSIPGVGLQSAAMLAVLLSRIPFERAEALIAYSGLDPRPRDSGRRRGQRHLSKRGPAQLRWLLYLAASSASRNAGFRPQYQALRERGLAGTEALNVLARKLLKIAFALWHSESMFDPGQLTRAKGS